MVLILRYRNNKEHPVQRSIFFSKPMVLPGSIESMDAPPAYMDAPPAYDTMTAGARGGGLVREISLPDVLREGEMNYGRKVSEEERRRFLATLGLPAGVQEAILESCRCGGGASTCTCVSLPDARRLRACGPVRSPSREGPNMCAYIWVGAQHVPAEDLGNRQFRQHDHGRRPQAFCKCSRPREAGTGGACGFVCGIRSLARLAHKARGNRRSRVHLSGSHALAGASWEMPSYGMPSSPRTSALRRNFGYAP
jgi:hypothetical protein